MNARMAPLAVALSLFATTAYAADLNLGTWKLNESKSVIPPGMFKTVTVVFEQVADGVKVTFDGVDKDGKPFHNGFTGTYDGKEYPVVGTPVADARSLKRVDAHHFTVVNKKGGKPTITIDYVTAKDGKTRTGTYSGTTAEGKPVSATMFYEKQ